MPKKPDCNCSRVLARDTEKAGYDLIDLGVSPKAVADLVQVMHAVRHLATDTADKALSVHNHNIRTSIVARRKICQVGATSLLACSSPVEQRLTGDFHQDEAAWPHLRLTVHILS